MLKKFLQIISGDPNKKILDKIYPLVDKINAFEPLIQKLSDDELKQKTNFFREKIKERLSSVSLEKYMKR